MCSTKLYTTVYHPLSNPLPLSIIILCRVSPSKITDPLKTWNWQLLIFFFCRKSVKLFRPLTSCLAGPLQIHVLQIHVLQIHFLQIHLLQIHVLQIHLLQIHLLQIHLLQIHVLQILLLQIHLLQIHVLQIHSMFYKSTPVHSTPCFTVCRN